MISHANSTIGMWMCSRCLRVPYAPLCKPAQRTGRVRPEARPFAWCNRGPGGQTPAETAGIERTPPRASLPCCKIHAVPRPWLLQLKWARNERCSGDAFPSGKNTKGRHRRENAELARLPGDRPSEPAPFLRARAWKPFACKQDAASSF